MISQNKTQFNPTHIILLFSYIFLKNLEEKKAARRMLMKLTPDVEFPSDAIFLCHLLVFLVKCII